MDAGTTIIEVRGGEAERFVDGLASLRIRVFRDFPYLYDGDMDYERRYLRPFRETGIAPDTICYYGESMLLPELRGTGFEFMVRRERVARSLPGVTHAAFCAVVRERAPAEYRPLEPFRERTGFRRVPGLVAGYSWKNLDHSKETKKRMQFWMKNLKETQ